MDKLMIEHVAMAINERANKEYNLYMLGKNECMDLADTAIKALLEYLGKNSGLAVYGEPLPIFQALADIRQLKNATDVFLEDSNKHSETGLGSPVKYTDGTDSREYDEQPKKSEARDWNCQCGWSHKQCGSHYGQTEPPFVEGLCGRYQLPYTKTSDVENG